MARPQEAMALDNASGNATPKRHSRLRQLCMAKSGEADLRKAAPPGYKGLFHKALLFHGL